MTDDHTQEFDCIDCGQPVVRIVTTHANDDHVCLTCSWIRNLQPEHREAARQFLKERYK